MRKPLAAAAFVALLAAPLPAADWKPGVFAAASTLELRTTAPGEGDHWFPVWVVVIDDQVYVRLGTRAAGRIERNTTEPYVGVRIAGQQFDRVRGVAAPRAGQCVVPCMAETDSSDVVIPHFDHHVD